MDSFLSDWILHKVGNVSSWIYISEICHLCWVFVNPLKNPASYVQPSHNTFWIRFDWVVDRFCSNIKFVSFIDPRCQMKWFSVVKRERCFHLDMKDFVISFFLMNYFVLDQHFIKFLERIVLHKEINNFLDCKVDDGLSFCDDWVGFGCFFVTFYFSISDRFPPLRVLELFDFLLNHRDELVKLFLIDSLHLMSDVRN